MSFQYRMEPPRSWEDPPDTGEWTCPLCGHTAEIVYDLDREAEMLCGGNPPEEPFWDDEILYHDYRQRRWAEPGPPYCANPDCEWERDR